jgi:hypothetical protein
LRRLGLTLLILLATVGTGCKTVELRASWTASPILIDGRADDWNDLPMAYFEDLQVALGVANDSSQLYLLLRSRDPKTARLIAQTGLTVQLAAQDGAELQLKFRAGPSRKDLRALMGTDSEAKDWHPDRERPRGNSKEEPELMVAVKDRVLLRQIATDGSNGPKAAYGASDGMFTWEFQIPLAASRVRWYGLGIGAGATISAKAVWGEFDRPDRPKPPEGVTSMGGGRGGRGGGDDWGSGRRPGGLSKPQRQEVSFKLLLSNGSEK